MNIAIAVGLILQLKKSCLFKTRPSSIITAAVTMSFLCFYHFTAKENIPCSV